MQYLVGLNKVGGTSVQSSEIQRMNEAGEISKNLENPTLRDTVQVTGGGYAVWRLKADNPGLWFFHCHVQTHMLEGQAFILQVGDAADFDVPPKGFPTSCMQTEKCTSGVSVPGFQLNIIILFIVLVQVFTTD